jgi:hypothetical protein
VAFGVVALIRIDAVWMATEPLDMRAGPETALARVVQVFGAAQGPRAIWLACLGWEATKPKSKALPHALPTAREYALAHA